MSSEQIDALLQYRITEAYTRLHSVSPDHSLLQYFRLRDGELCWNMNDGGLHVFGFHTQFADISTTFFTDPDYLANACDAPLFEKFEHYIFALEDAVSW